MGMSVILLQYQARLFALHASMSQLRLGQVIAITIAIAAIMAFVILASFSVVRRTLPFPVSLIPLPMAIYGVRLYRKRASELLKTLRLETHYERGVARLEGNWAGSGFRGEEFITDGHCYGKDLNVVGEGSLFELLCTCRTDVGRQRLADYLLNPATQEESIKRQEAVKELKPETVLRERISSLGSYQFQEVSSRTITEWLDSSLQPVRPWFRCTVLLSSSCLSCLALLAWDHYLAWISVIPWIVGFMIAHCWLGYIHREKLFASSRAIRSIATDISVLRNGLELMQNLDVASPLLKRLVENSRKGDPCGSISRLEWLLKAFTERDKEYFYLISRVLLVGTQLFWAIEHWRMLHREALMMWLTVWGEFEALVALSNYAYEHPEGTFPELSPERAIFEGKAIGHPLLPPDLCVRNHVVLNPRNQFYMISGSNMAGKSTMLRTIGLNAVLAYAGAPVCAASLELSQLQVCASLAVQDSLMDGKSKFLAELQRIRVALSAPTDGRSVLFLVDELLSGTNSADRRVAAEAILRELMRQGAIGAVSTHDLTLTEIAMFADLNGTNVHMASRDDADPLDFDYLLKPGVTRQSSALAIARLAGVTI